jgi:adenylate cyclase
MARVALGELGENRGSLLAADLTHIWIAGPVEVDAEIHEEALRVALASDSGPRRAARLRSALASEAAHGELLADEPDEEWARAPRERLDALRQEARLALARDLSSGPATDSPDDVMAVWLSCLDHDRACEEAAGALARAYVAQHRPEQAARVLRRCRAALEELGLRLSPSLENVYAAAAAPAVAHAGTRPIPAEPPPREERRPVSVLFAEVAASPVTAGTAAGTRDLEALRESVGGVLAAVMTEVETLGGTVTSVSGRGIQALFGVPSAHEDDPERAVRAAYRAVTRIASGNGPTARTISAATTRTGLRIGVESGPAVVGPVTGGARAEYTAFGDVVSAAAALQSAARPGSVLVGPATRAATEHLFTWGAVEKVALDLGGEPVAATYLDSPRAGSASRRPPLERMAPVEEVAPLGGTAPLAGRDAEMRVLAGALRELAGGRGSVVALTGEPGLGKTRLTQEARARFLAWAGAGTGRLPLWLDGRCVSYAAATPYGLYRQLLASWTGVSPDQPAALRASALEQTLLRVMGNANLLPSLARMAGLPAGNPPGPAAPALTNGAQANRQPGPAETQRMIFDAMRSLVTRLTAIAPAVLLLEDLHWADPTSFHLTRYLAALTGNRPLLMLVTGRPEAAGDIAAIAPGVRQVRLRRLPPAAARGLARSLIGDAGESVLDAVVSPAGGNPLFLEERLAALLETRTLVRDQGTWSLRDTTDPQVSQVLERLVRSRIDRLSPPAQEAVRAASVLGFEFQAAQLSRMLASTGLASTGLDGEPGATLDSVLEELHASDLIHHQQPRGPEPVFVFRHALIQEAAYLGLLRAERRALHARAAAAIEAAAQDAIPEVAALLGRHYASADDSERAVHFLEIAGDHATRAFANDEAISSYRTAIELVTGDDLVLTDPVLANTALRLHAELANVLWRTGRRAQTREMFQEALRIAGTGRASDLLRAHLHTRLGRLSLIDYRLAEAAASFDAAEALLGDDPGGGDDATVDQWLELMIDGRADLHWLRGETDLAEAALEAARPLLETRGNPARKTIFYRLVVMQRLARSGMLPGDDDVELLRRSLEFARQTGEDKDAAYAAHFLGWILGLRGHVDEARAAEQMTVEMADRIGESFLLPGALAALALIALRQHDTATARSCLSRALALLRDSDSEHSDESGKASVFPLNAAVCRAVLAWLDRPRDGQSGNAPDLADELARLMGIVPGSARWNHELLLTLARGLPHPGPR